MHWMSTEKPTPMRWEPMNRCLGLVFGFWILVGPRDESNKKSAQRNSYVKR